MKFFKTIFKKKRNEEKPIEIDTNLEKFELESYYFYVEKDIKNLLKEETEKTISMMKKIGYKIEIEYVDIFSYGSVWVSFIKDEEHFRINFDFNKKTKILIRTGFFIPSKKPEKLREDFIKKFNDVSVESDRVGDIIYPITYIQKEKIRLVFV